MRNIHLIPFLLFALFTPPSLSPASEDYMEACVDFIGENPNFSIEKVQACKGYEDVESCLELGMLENITVSKIENCQTKGYGYSYFLWDAQKACLKIANLTLDNRNSKKIDICVEKNPKNPVIGTRCIDVIKDYQGVSDEDFALCVGYFYGGGRTYYGYLINCLKIAANKDMKITRVISCFRKEGRDAKMDCFETIFDEDYLNVPDRRMNFCIERYSYWQDYSLDNCLKYFEKIPINNIEACVHAGEPKLIKTCTNVLNVEQNPSLSKEMVTDIVRSCDGYVYGGRNQEYCWKLVTKTPYPKSAYLARYCKKWDPLRFSCLERALAFKDMNEAVDKLEGCRRSAEKVACSLWLREEKYRAIPKEKFLACTNASKSRGDGWSMKRDCLDKVIEDPSFDPS